jgi:NAD(P)H dehydrogenase (quinone)
MTVKERSMAPVKLAVIYYSATGTNYQMAKAAADAAEQAGAEVRLCRVQELAPDTAIDSNPAWRAHVEATREVPVATLDDLEWADAYLFGSPTRFGNMAGQLKQFIDTAGGLWYQGKLSNKVASCFACAHNAHGGQESTLLAMYNSLYHWGCFIVPPGYTDPSIFAAGGNPYGASSNAVTTDPVSPEVLEAMRYQARRMVQVAEWIAAGRNVAVG